MILYGIDDMGNIQGTDVSRQDFDQPLQGSLRQTITPSPSVELHSISVLNNEVLAIVVPPWNKKDVYVCSGKILIRRGTNAFVVKDDEARKLYDGKYID
ncbi:MAG: ATP-binding protein [Chloroflexi bacterium]|nr:ATP-binding protein [Chloroflexota bacterium]